MLDHIKNIFSEVLLNSKEIIAIASISKLKKVKKGELLVRSGEVDHRIIVVIKGLLRHYCLDENGVEKSILFVNEKESTGSIETIFQNKPSYENIQAIEDSIIIVFDNRKMEKLAEKSRGLLRLQNKKLKMALANSVGRLRHHTILTPEEHYHQFCNKYPKLEQRVIQKHLASYLGITPTSLSRMRARALKKRSE